MRLLATRRTTKNEKRHEMGRYRKYMYLHLRYDIDIDYKKFFSVSNAFICEYKDTA